MPDAAHRQIQNALQMIETPVLDTLVQMSENTLERARLDAETFMLLRTAALVSVGAAPASYKANFGNRICRDERHR